MRAIGYVRVSTGSQAESGLGLEAQRNAIAACARRVAAELGPIHEDAGLSGSLSLEDRPGLLAAVADLRRGDILLVAKRDRLGRDVVALALVERLILKKGARVVSAAGEGTESDDPSSVLMRRLLDAFAEHERLLIGARTKAALAAKKARGERAGNVPFGFRALESGRLEPEPTEQETMRLVRTLREAGCSLREIVSGLRDRGVVGRTGQPLTLKRVHALARVA